MKNIIAALVLVCGMINFTHAGECASGVCVQPRRVVVVTKNVVKETVRLPRRWVSGCANGSCRSRSVTVVR